MSHEPRPSRQKNKNTTSLTSLMCDNLDTNVFDCMFETEFRPGFRRQTPKHKAPRCNKTPWVHCLDRCGPLRHPKREAQHSDSGSGWRAGGRRGLGWATAEHNVGNDFEGPTGASARDGGYPVFELWWDRLCFCRPLRKHCVGECREMCFPIAPRAPHFKRMFPRFVFCHV